MAKVTRKRGKIAVKDMKFKNDPMVRLYDHTQEWLQERGRPVAIGVAAVAGAVVLYAIVVFFLDHRRDVAQTAYGKALEKYSAPVQDTPPPQNAKYYTDETTKWQETAEAFEQLANSYSSQYGAIGRYYGGVAYLHLDRNKGLQMLQQAAAKNEQPTSDLARMALAQDALINGDAEGAIVLYQKLIDSSSSLKPTAQLGLGHAYEKQGDLKKAADAYFEAASFDRASSATDSDAQKRLSAIAPERIKDLPPPDTSRFSVP